MTTFNEETYEVSAGGQSFGDFLDKQDQYYRDFVTLSYTDFTHEETRYFEAHHPLNPEQMRLRHTEVSYNILHVTFTCSTAFFFTAIFCFVLNSWIESVRQHHEICQFHNQNGSVPSHL